MSTDQSRPEPSGPIDTTQPMDATRPIELRLDDSPTTEFAVTDSPATDSPATEPPRSTLRVGTVVWGLVLALIGAGVIAVAAGARFDLELASIGLLALAGVALLAGSIATSARRRHR